MNIKKIKILFNLTLATFTLTLPLSKISAMEKPKQAHSMNNTSNENLKADKSNFINKLCELLETVNVNPEKSYEDISNSSLKENDKTNFSSEKNFNEHFQENAAEKYKASLNKIIKQIEEILFKNKNEIVENDEKTLNELIGKYEMLNEQGKYEKILFEIQDNIGCYKTSEELYNNEKKEKKYENSQKIIEEYKEKLKHHKNEIKKYREKKYTTFLDKTIEKIKDILSKSKSQITPENEKTLDDLIKEYEKILSQKQNEIYEYYIPSSEENSALYNDIDISSKDYFDYLEILNKYKENLEDCKDRIIESYKQNLDKILKSIVSILYKKQNNKITLNKLMEQYKIQLNKLEKKLTERNKKIEEYHNVIGKYEKNENYKNYEEYEECSEDYEEYNNDIEKYYGVDYELCKKRVEKYNEDKIDLESYKYQSEYFKSIIEKKYEQSSTINNKDKLINKKNLDEIIKSIESILGEETDQQENKKNIKLELKQLIVNFEEKLNNLKKCFTQDDRGIIEDLETLNLIKENLNDYKDNKDYISLLIKYKKRPQEDIYNKRYFINYKNNLALYKNIYKEKCKEDSKNFK